MATFVALYRGQTIAEAEIIGVSVDRQLVARIAEALLADASEPTHDPILAVKHRAERALLRLVRDEAAGASSPEPTA